MIAATLWAIALVAAGAAYVAGMRADARRPRARPMPRWKLAVLLAGLVAAGAVVAAPLSGLSDRLVSAHFLGVFLLTMVAAPLIVLSSPLTLAFRALGPTGRKRLRRAVRRGPVAFVTLPPVAWLTFAVVTYVWQFSGLAGDAAEHAWVREIEHVSVLAVGLLFWQPALATDPWRWHMVVPLRLLYVIAEMTHKALFGAIFLALDSPLHPEIAARAPGWAPEPMLDQTIGILVSWIGGNLIFVAALAWLAVEWTRAEGRGARRIDRKLARQREERRRRSEAMRQIFDRSSPGTPTAEGGARQSPKS